MKKNRILSYDVFRGVLLVGMVVFHLIVNLTSWEFDQQIFYWVPLGFVMFLGVILARFLQGKTRKKIGLAVKLGVIFLIGNIPNFLHNHLELQDFLWGNQELMSFEILAPMVMTIFVSPILDKMKSSKFWLYTVVLIMFVFQYANLYSYNVMFILYGFFGYFMGRAHDINGYLEQKNWKLMLITTVLVVSYPFTIKYLGLWGALICVQILGMYFLANYLWKNSEILVKLGKYSLVLYVFHIVAIKVISKFYHKENIAYFVAFSLVFCLGMYASVMIFEKLKSVIFIRKR